MDKKRVNIAYPKFPLLVRNNGRSILVSNVNSETEVKDTNESSVRNQSSVTMPLYVNNFLPTNIGYKSVKKGKSELPLKIEDTLERNSSLLERNVLTYMKSYQYSAEQMGNVYCTVGYTKEELGEFEISERALSLEGEEVQSNYVFNTGFSILPLAGIVAAIDDTIYEEDAPTTKIQLLQLYDILSDSYYIFCYGRRRTRGGEGTAVYDTAFPLRITIPSNLIKVSNATSKEVETFFNNMFDITFTIKKRVFDSDTESWFTIIDAPEIVQPTCRVVSYTDIISGVIFSEDILLVSISQVKLEVDISKVNTAVPDSISVDDGLIGFFLMSKSYYDYMITKIPIIRDGYAIIYREWDDIGTWAQTSYGVINFNILDKITGERLSGLDNYYATITYNSYATVG